MEAKDHSMIKMKDEMDFFSLIERKLEREGFKVLETLPPQRNLSKKCKSVFTYRSMKRFA